MLSIALNYLVYFFLILFIASCGTTRKGTVIEQGEASWYGPGFHGRTTANGETYNQNALTAAHRTLPFDTVIRVINMNNGKHVTVRINDRGPYVSGRIIDLSKEAAARIDMVESGVAPVRLILIDSPHNLRLRGSGSIRQEEFTVQLASYSYRSDAEAFSSKISGSRVVMARVQNQTVYRVYYGRYRQPEDAQNDLNRFRSQGVEGFIKQVQN